MSECATIASGRKHVPAHKNFAAVCAIAVSNCDGVSVTEGLALDWEAEAVSADVRSNPSKYIM
jgi:hypothetical protein